MFLSIVVMVIVMPGQTMGFSDKASKEIVSELLSYEDQVAEARQLEKILKNKFLEQYNIYTKPILFLILLHLGVCVWLIITNSASNDNNVENV